jgi:small subunit ribosomal protein S1
LIKTAKKISLGIKQLSQDPWEHVEQQYPLNSVINGEVSKIANFGAFVKLDTGIEGLIHNTTLASEQSGKKASDLFTVGQKVELRVVNVNRQERKLGLSTRLDSQAAQPSHAQPMSYNNAPSSTGAAKPKARRTTSSTQKDQPQQQQRSGIRSHTSQNEAPASNMKSSLQMALEGAMKKHDDENSGE